MQYLVSDFMTMILATEIVWKVHLEELRWNLINIFFCRTKKINVDVNRCEWNDW